MKSFGQSKEYKKYPVVTAVAQKYWTQLSIPPETTKGYLRQATFIRASIPHQQN